MRNYVNYFKTLLYSDSQESKTNWQWFFTLYIINILTTLKYINIKKSNKSKIVCLK